MLSTHFAAMEGASLNSNLSALATYRSYFATGTGDTDPTGDLPYGPGWIDGLGDGLLQGAQPGGTVIWVDALGATWTFDDPTGVQDPANPLSTIWVYEAHRGSRMLHWGGTFYRELADHTLIEYEPKPGTIPTGQVAYRVKRTFRGDRSSPRWELKYVYGSPDPVEYPNLVRLLRVEGDRGYHFLFSWTRYVVSSVDHWRITKIGLTNPNLDPTGWDWSLFDVDLTYDSHARLHEVRYPDRSLVYDPSGNGQVTGLQTLKAEGLRFEYASSSDHRITRVSRLLKSTNWSSPQVDLILENTYQATTTWRLTTQTDRPGHIDQRVHTFSEPAAQTLRWKDPIGVEHDFVYTTGTGSPTKRHVTSYSRNPLRSDPDGHGKLTWTFSWDNCACGRLTSIQLPTGRRLEMDYDGEDRGFLTAVRLMTSPSDADPRVWFHAYEPWGYPWDPEGIFVRASRVKSYQYKDENGSLVTWTIDNLYDGNGGVRTDMKIPKPGTQTEFYVYSVHEDSLQRITKVEYPEHAYNGTASTNRVTTDFVYLTDIGLPGYKSLWTMIQHRPDQNDTLKPVPSMYVYDMLGRPIELIDEHGRNTFLTYDNIGNTLSITPPAATSGKDQTKQIVSKVDVEWGLFGDIARIKRLANTVDGTPYAKAEVAGEAASDIFGELGESRVDAAKMDQVTPLWLLTKRKHDKLGRTIEVEFPAGRMTRYVVNDFDLISEVRFRDSTTNNNDTTWPRRKISYDAEGRRSRYEDASGLVHVFDYEAHGRLWKARHVASGKEIHVVYPRDLTAQQGSLGLPKKIQYWIGANLSTERVWNRDKLGRPSSITFTDVPNGNSASSTYVWNGLRRLSTVTDGDGRSSTLAFDKAGLIKWVEDSLTASDRNRMEVTRNLQAEVTGLLRKVQKEDAQGAFSQITYKSAFVYDELSRITVLERFGRSAAKVAERRFAFDSLGGQTWFQRQLDSSTFIVTEQDFDAVGRLRKTTRHPKTGDASSPIVTLTDFDDNPGSYGDDGFGTALDATNLSRVVTRQDGRGLQSTYLVDLLGRLVEHRMPGYTSAGAGFSWTYRHDDEARVDKWKDGNGHVIKVSRDSEKRSIQRHIETLGTGSGLSEMTKWEKWDYDSLGRKITYRTHNGPLSQAPGTGDQWLVNVVREYDALTRLVAEDFGYGDNGLSTDSRVHKKLVSSYSHVGGDDTGFRRGLVLPTGFDFKFTPDGAGKLSQISLKGPQDASHGLVAHYRYEGGRAHLRDWRPYPGPTGNNPFYRTTWATNDLGYLTQLTTVFDPTSQGPTTVFDQEQGRDFEGNVLWKKYTKQVGGGDWFKIDGFERLEEAKLGAPASDFGPGKTYASAGYDTKLAYAMDVAHNRTSVTETKFGQSPVTTTYTVDTVSNRYVDAGSGLLVYDLNGNLVYDGFRLYVYDYLGRLCEVWDYVVGTASSSSSSSTTQRKPVKLTREKVHSLLKTRRKPSYSRTSLGPGIAAYNRSTKNGRAATSSSSSSGGDFILLALYGYDGMNRRILRTTTTTTEGIRYSTWDNWRMTEEYEDLGGSDFSPRKVFFDGVGIDAHPGYAVSSNGTTWTRYTITQDSLGHVMGVFLAGDTLPTEKYEYDTYGTRLIWVKNPQTQQYDPVSATTVDNHYGYTGRRHDPETGFVYYRLRYYSPLMGRFLTQDPLGNWRDTANWGNGYAYVGSAPVRHADPFGLETWASPEFGSPGGGDGPGSPGGPADPGGSGFPDDTGGPGGPDDGGKADPSGLKCDVTKQVTGMSITDDIDAQIAALVEKGMRKYKEVEELEFDLYDLKKKRRAGRHYIVTLRVLGSGKAIDGYNIMRACGGKVALPPTDLKALIWAIAEFTGGEIAEWLGIAPHPEKVSGDIKKNLDPAMADLEFDIEELYEVIEEIAGEIQKLKKKKKKK